MLEKLAKLIKYAENIGHGIAATPHLVAEESNATTALASPGLNGPQVVVALPMAELSGNTDGMTASHVIIIYALEKRGSSESTPAGQTKQYLRMLDLLGQLIDRFVEDITASSEEDKCPLLCGLDVGEIKVMPESNTFGGWNGWSATIVLN